MRKSRRPFLSRLALPLLSVFTIGACGGPSPEHQVLTRLFDASRLYDRTRLASLGSVVFNPVTDGVVHEFAITKVDTSGAPDAAPVSEQVTLTAQVRAADGRISPRTLIATMEKTDGQWRVVSLR